ncbi:MAG: hypothetical protein ACM30G_23035 [Micromonosporaceae bacterium]
MADREGGGTKIMRGLATALAIVAALVLLVVFRSQVADFGRWIGDYVWDHVPGAAGQKVAVVVYLIVAALVGILFSQAGHFTAYGIAMGLGPLLWFLFWEGFPLLGLKPSWTGSMGLGHLPPGQVIVWAIVAVAVITLVFVPLELREKFQRRKHQLADTD